MPSERGVAIDIFCSVLTTITSVSFLIAIILIYTKRRIPYIQAKQPVLLIIQCVAAILWSISSLATHGHFDRQGLLENCVLWDLWIKVALGFGLWINCLTFRTLRMYWTLGKKSTWISNKTQQQQRTWNPNKKSPLQRFDKRRVVTFLLLEMPWVVLCIGLGAANQVSLNPEKLQCIYKSKIWPIVVISLGFLPMVGFTCISKKLTKYSQKLSEYQEIVRGFVIMTILLFISFIFQVLHWADVGVGDGFRTFNRFFRTMCVNFAVLYFFWFFNWEQLYASVFDHENYLKKFRLELQSIEEERNRGMTNQSDAYRENHVNSVVDDVEESFKMRVMSTELQESVQNPIS